MKTTVKEGEDAQVQGWDVKDVKNKFVLNAGNHMSISLNNTCDCKISDNCMILQI